MDQPSFHKYMWEALHKAMSAGSKALPVSCLSHAHHHDVCAEYQLFLARGGWPYGLSRQLETCNNGIIWTSQRRFSHYIMFTLDLLQIANLMQLENKYLYFWLQERRFLASMRKFMFVCRESMCLCTTYAWVNVWEPTWLHFLAY